MRALRSRLARSLLPGAIVAGFALAGAARAQEAPEPPSENWSFSGPFGAYDLAAAQRGFQIYSEVCSNCHSMRLMFYRNLTGIGLNLDQIRAIASNVQVPAGLNDQGEPVTGPGLPSSHFRSPFANEQAARAANNGALPPDLSLIVNAREGGANYVYGILTGYEDAPEGFNLMEGMNYNKYFPGHQIAMPKPLSEGQVTYTDGTPNTLEQEAHDVVTFLAWAANPEMVQRKQIGVRAVLFLVLMTGLTYAVKRKVWAEAH
jgi:ubiquinol-cytochrome c reductase cytochrome c1 subunit